MRTTTIFVALVALAPMRARADAAAEARFHDEAARRHYEAGRYDAAVREFMTSQRAAPNPNTVLNIAFCFQRLERHDEAYMYFLEYLATAPPHPERRQRAERALEELRPRVALVEVTSEPAGAAIFVDREELGQYGITPRVLALPAGEHRLWVEAAGHRPAEQVVDLAAGEEVTVSLAPEQIVGGLRITSSADAHVRLTSADGAIAWEGPTPVDVSLPVGNYEAHARSDGGDRWTEPLTVREGDVTEAHAELRGPVGELGVVANLPGALLRLDGREWGFAPQISTDVPVGEHQLEVSLDGARTYAGSVEVSEDSRAWVDVSLSQTPDGPFADDVLIAGGATLAILAAAGILTGLTAASDGSVQDAQAAGQPYVASLEETNRLAVASDLLWLTGGAAVVVTLVLAIVHSIDTSGPSTARVTRRDR